MNGETYPCWRCGQPLAKLIFPISRREECAACRAEVHVCRMCRHYQPRPREWCREDRAELPATADSANFCDYFHLEAKAWDNPQASDTNARDQLDALFSGNGGGAKPDPGGDLKSLFDDD